jgi:D-methionine transport system substrate-binding protein
MKKRNLLQLLILVILAFFITGCGSDSGKKIKVGINGSNSEQWEHIKKEAEKKGIKLEIVYFSDYVQPNRALVDKDVDINAFQTVSFLNTFNETNKQNIVPIATTVLAPMGIYSKKIKSLDELPEKAKITIPNDPSNQGRALKLLEKAGLIKLKDNGSKIISNNDIAENPKQLEIIPMAANQLPQTLNDAEVAVINNGVAVDAGLSLSQAIYKEDKLAKDYINVIAARQDNKDDERLQEIVKLYQSEDVKKIIEAQTKGNSIPTFIPLSEIGF